MKYTSLQDIMLWLTHVKAFERQKQLVLGYEIYSRGELYIFIDFTNLKVVVYSFKGNTVKPRGEAKSFENAREFIEIVTPHLQENDK